MLRRLSLSLLIRKVHTTGGLLCSQCSHNSSVASSSSASSSSASSSNPLTSSSDASVGASSGIGATLSSSGFTAPTPNFNVDFNSVPETDMGEITNTPVANVSLAEMEGPWLVLTDKLQGELMVDCNGGVMFRPAGLLGSGVGKITLQESTLNVTMFKLELETYLYENKPSNPPCSPTRFSVTGMIQDAYASKNDYRTRTLVGSAEVAGEVSQFNAAQLTPWDPKSEQPWIPSKEVQEGFQMIFSKLLPLSLNSHKARAQQRQQELSTQKKDSPLCAPYHMDLTKYKVGDINSLYYIPDYITVAEEEQLMAHLKETPEQLKTKLTKRLVQEWGCAMCPTCNQSFVADYNLPPWSKAINDMLLYDGIFSPSIFPNNVRIHEYEKGEGIAPHCDGPIYVPLVAILSMASTSVMNFYPRREPYDDKPMEYYNDTFRFDGDIAKQKPLLSVVMEPRSLLIFKDDAYTLYPHGVSDKDIDLLDEEHAGVVANRHFLTNPDMTQVERKYRVGVTVRNLLPRCSHHPQRAEYNMREAWTLYNQGADDVFTKPVHYGSSTSSPASAQHPPSNNTPSNITATSAMGSTVVSRQEWEQMRRDVDTLTSQQKQILTVLQDIQAVVGYNTTTTQTFQKEVSGILNHLSTTVLDVQCEVKAIADKVLEDNLDNDNKP